MHTWVWLANLANRNRLKNWWAILKPILTPLDVLPAFQVQVLICTGDSGSSQSQHFSNISKLYRPKILYKLYCKQYS